MKTIPLFLLISALMLNAASAGPADVVKVDVKPAGADTFQFFVTVRHDDKGWDHYANKWDVVAPDGTVLATRTLHHPHENEQPFTRSLGGVTIPSDISTVSVQAHDSVHGYGGKTITIRLPR
jgi:hypothetical protein